MRRTAAFLALAMSVTLVACGENEDPVNASDATSDASDDGATGDVDTTPGTEMPTLDTSGENPILSFPDSNPPEGLQVEVLEEGTGRVIEDTDEVRAHYVGQVWGNSEPFDSSFERGAATDFPLQGVIAGWTEGLTGLKVGSKVIMSIPADKGYGPSGGNPGAGIGPEDTIAFYIEVKSAYGADQAGEADATLQVDLADLPVVIDGELGEPISITVKDDADEPTEVVTTVIARGSGDPIGSVGTTIINQFAMSFWDNSATEVTYTQFGPQKQVVGNGSIFDSLEGIPVGSRVLVEVPATDGGPDEVTAPAYAVVIDILGQIRGAKDRPTGGATGGEPDSEASPTD